MAARATLDAWQREAEREYDLALDAEARGDRATMVRHFLRVRALDAKCDRAVGLGTPAELDHIERIARETLEALPEPFLGRLTHVPVVMERRPDRELVRSGFDPRSLGLFDGAIHGDDETPAPTRIVIYTCNLLAEFADDELSEQVRVTILHEVGHFFGIDDEGLNELGLG